MDLNESEIVAEPESTKRRWWVAFILMVLGGSGYLYVGRPRRYAVYFGFNAVLIAALYDGLWGWLSDPVVFMSMVGMALFITLGFWIDGGRLAVAQKRYMLRWYNRWWIYAACLAAMLIINSLPNLTFGRISLAARHYSMPAGSMAPTLMVGDFIIADARAYETSVPERGDIVIFKLPKAPTVDYTKRVIGLPGERVQMVDGMVYIDGVGVPREHLDEFVTPEGRTIVRYRETLPNGVSHLTQHVEGDTWADDTEEFDVSENHYFMLGDNRDNSNDSRFVDGVGYVLRQNVHSQVRGVTVSRDWNRFGLRVK